MGTGGVRISGLSKSREQRCEINVAPRLKGCPADVGDIKMAYVHRCMKGPLGRAAIAFGLAFALPASAWCHSKGSSQVDLALSIYGKISPKCELALNDRNIDVILTDKAGTASLPFTLDCNQKMSVQLRSLNGGLQHEALGSAPKYAGFVNFVPYTATFQVNADGAQPFSAESKRMTSAVQGHIGRGSSQTTGAISFAWEATPPLLGGRYKDVIEIRVSGD